MSGGTESARIASRSGPRRPLPIQASDLPSRISGQPTANANSDSDTPVSAYPDDHQGLPPADPVRVVADAELDEIGQGVAGAFGQAEEVAWDCRTVKNPGITAVAIS